MKHETFIVEEMINSVAATVCSFNARLGSADLTLLWYHEKSYVDSTMGSI